MKKRATKGDALIIRPQSITIRFSGKNEYEIQPIFDLLRQLFSAIMPNRGFSITWIKKEDAPENVVV